MGCLPKRLERETRPRPLADVVKSVTEAYQGVNSLTGRISVRALAEGEGYYAQGILWYEKPDSLRIRLTAPLGGTVGDVLTSRGLVYIALPATGKAFVGQVTGTSGASLGDLLVQVEYAEHEERDGVRVPTRIYGVVEPFSFRFDVKLKTFEVNRPLPDAVFGRAPEGYEYLPLSALKSFLGWAAEEGKP